MSESILKHELESMGGRIKNLRLDTRAEIDRLNLEIEALRLFVEWANPNTAEVYRDIRYRVFHGINPEKEHVLQYR
ncbi:MAG TPA: hypothetical protein VL688_11515 [Verrucomicrobiae bacterium]|jgi:hypothetical protein|nr:hypothetical protein [Verrucomicrobiae bacterium]